MGFIDHMQRHLSKERGGRGGPSSRGAATPLAVRARAFGMLAIILIGTIAGAFLMNTPGIFAAPGTAQIEAINADELEPEGYSWSIDFDGIEIENGWTYEEDIFQYHCWSADGIFEPGPDDPDDTTQQAYGSDGYAFFIDEDTPKSEPTLRYTGGSYNGQAVDALVTLKDWTYLEVYNGWNNFWEVEQYKNFQPGVFVNAQYKALTDKDTGIQNFNFYTVGLGDLQVDVEWVLAGTDTPVELKGHTTCIDLDVRQGFSFGGSVTGGRILSGNPAITIEDGGKRAQSADVSLSVDFRKNPEEYQNGLVEVFFDTTQEGGHAGEASEFYFDTSWGINDAGSDVATSGTTPSFFALTTDFLTAPSEHDKHTPIVKSADKTSGLAVGDEVTFAVDYTAHEEGVTCSGGWRYTSLELTDVLPSELRYVEGTARVLMDGSDITADAGTISADMSVEPSPEEDSPEEEVPDEEADNTEGDVDTGANNEDDVITDTSDLSSDERPAVETPDPDSTNDPTAPSDGETASNTVRYTFNPTYLSNTALTGQHYQLVFTARLVAIPPETQRNEAGELYVRNSSYALVNGTDENWSNDVDLTIVDPLAAVNLFKSVDPQVVPVGDWATYTVTASVADNPARKVVLTDDSLPDGMTLDRESIALTLDDEPVENAAISGEGNAIIVTLDSIGAGSSLELTYRAQVTSDTLAGSDVTNTVTLAASTLEEPLQAEATISIPLDPSETTLTKTVDRSTLLVGDEAHYTIEVQVEDAGSGIENAMIEDSGLPEGMVINLDSIAIALNGEPLDVATVQPSGTGFNTSLGSLEPGSVVTITYTATATDPALAEHDIVNTATLTSDSLDEPLTATASVQVVLPGDSTITKQVEPQTIHVGDTAHYTIETTAGEDLSDVTITDTGLPEGMVIDMATLEVTVNGETLAEPSIEQKGTGFVLALDELAADDAITISYDAQAADENLAGTSATNQVELSSPDLDEPLNAKTTVSIEEEAAPENPAPTDENDDPKPQDPEDPEPTPEPEPETPEKDRGEYIEKTGDWMREHALLLVAGCAGMSIIGALIYRYRIGARGDDWGIHHPL